VEDELNADENHNKYPPNPRKSYYKRGGKEKGLNVEPIKFTTKEYSPGMLAGTFCYLPTKPHPNESTQETSALSYLRKQVFPELMLLPCAKPFIGKTNKMKIPVIRN